MEERRKQTTIQQLEIMIEYLNKHIDLALGRSKTKEARAVATRLWRVLTVILNEKGPSRNAKEWAKIWNDFKCRVRTKMSSKGGLKQSPLTPLEEKVANIMGRGFLKPQVTYSDLSYVEEESALMECLTGVSYDRNRQANPLKDEDRKIEINLSPMIHTDAYEHPRESPSPVSPAPSPMGQAPSPPSTPRLSENIKRRKKLRARRRSSPSTDSTKSEGSQFEEAARTPLDESRLMIMRIEEMRARADLKIAEAALKIADSFKLIAGSIDRCSQMYFQRNGNSHGD